MLDRSAALPDPFDRTAVFATFDRQDSGCVGFGVVHDGRRRFVKVATTEAAATSLRRAIAFHAAVRHPAIVAPVEVAAGDPEVGRDDGPPAREVPIDPHDGPVLVYPWCEGTVLNAATLAGSDRSGLAAFQRLPVPQVEAAIDAILDAHLAVVAAGFVAVDLYDGCFLYDADDAALHLIDLDEYRPGPFVLDRDRLPGSTRYLAPEALVRGSTIDERTTVFELGRTEVHLLSDPDGRWRGTAGQRALVEAATVADPAGRLPSVAALVERWRTS